jgi:D-glycero-D-manno-heptose 1,7-bisphosphate phosphatase
MLVSPTTHKSMNADLHSSSPSRQRAVLLDRDGVININHGYVHHPDNFKFIDGIFDVAQAAQAIGYKLIVITNQAGIGRGYYSEQQFQELTDWMCNEFLDAGVGIEKVYFSPFHPTKGLGKYKKDDISRKPRPGMILQAQQEMDLDLGRSILIGDSASDIHAGISAGVGTNLLFSKYPLPELSGLSYQVITTLSEALPFINGSRQLGETS